MRRYAWREVLRNPRRTLASLTGITLGVGLFCAVLFYIDGSRATMTQRALAPLTLDLQRLLDAPQPPGLALRERIADRRDGTVIVELAVTNRGSAPAHDVVVNDEPPAPLTYLRNSTRLHDRAVRDVGARSPLAQGPARTGLNIGTLAPGATVALHYLARAPRDGGAPRHLRPRGTVSSREQLVPLAANARPPLALAPLVRRLARIPGVAAVDGLSFVDLPPGSLASRRGTAPRRVRLFAFDDAYRRHHPSVRVVSGALRAQSAVLSLEAARAIGAGRGAIVALRLPGRAAPLRLPVAGTADLTRATPLFSSRKISKFEDFIYVPDVVVVSPSTFARVVVPAFDAAIAQRGAIVKSRPRAEADLMVDRARLDADPGRALAQTRAIARAVAGVGPDADTVVDNISNALRVAREDAAVGRRMFMILGLPGILLAAFLAAYAGTILAAAQRRELAVLRLHGAHRGHLLHLLAHRTLLMAGAGSLLGAALGFASALAIHGAHTQFEATAPDLLRSALLGVAVGFGVTAVALYVPGRRSLARQIGDERRELGPAPRRRGRRGAELALLAAVAAAVIVADRTGAVRAQAGSVSEGLAVQLPSRLLIAPMLAWVAGALLAGRLAMAVTARAPLPASPRYGPVVRGTLARSLRRRPRSLAVGVVGVALVAAFGAILAVFAATYDAAKAADARFTVGADLRITPSATARARADGRLHVAAAAAVTPVLARAENAVLVGPFDQNRQDLAAIDARGFRALAARGDAGPAVAALAAHPRGLLVSATTAEELDVAVGDVVGVLLARGTKRQALRRFPVVGRFDRFPAFPDGVDLVVDRRRYRADTGVSGADFFLAQTADERRAVGELRRRGIAVDTPATALDRDQSSLTALDIHGLVDIDSLYMLLMSAAAIAIFVFGVMLHRRREYVALRALGLQAGELRRLVLIEAALVAVAGLAAGVLVGIGAGALLVGALTPLFVLDPGLTVPVGDLARLALLVAAATVASGIAATVVLGRLPPSEVLRDV